MKKIMVGAGKRKNQKGFTLLELAIVLAGLMIVTTSAVPYYIRQVETIAAQKTAKEVSAIQEAAKWYRIQNNAWPASIAALQSAGFLNPSWNPVNPWGNSYFISSGPTSLTVGITLPDSMGGVLSRALPGVSWTTVGSNRTISSAIPVPGQEASLTGVTNLANNAQNAANSAQSSANSAQSTANSAQSTASSAQSAANTAQFSANSAQSTANSAQSTANSALNMAQSSAVPPYGSTLWVGVNPDSWMPRYECPSGYVMMGWMNFCDSDSESTCAQWYRGVECQRVSR